MANISLPSTLQVRQTTPSALETTWYIARRGALESLRDRTTLSMSMIFALVLPFFFVLLVIRPQALLANHKGALDFENVLASYLLVIGLIPSSGAISIASGLFAGEHEQGNLAPLLATPASNRAIFGGKVLGAVIPSLLYSGFAIASYLVEVAVFIGADRLRGLPIPLSIAMIALVPTYAVLGATVASLVSSRVRTFQSAQAISSLILVPIMAILLGIAFLMRHFGTWSLLVMFVVLIVVDVLLIVVSASSWRREEILARR